MPTEWRSPTKWSRLKSGPQDPLDSVGLVSKGDEQLLNLRTQETYFSTILMRYMKFCANHRDESLADALSGMSIDDHGDAYSGSTLYGSPSKEGAKPAKEAQAINTDALKEQQARNEELGKLLMAMRKLREALVATNREDAFAKRSLMFITRATILASSYEAYYPSLTRLLEYCHRRSPLPPSDLREFASYHVLDLACRRGAYTEALLAKRKWGLKDERIEAVLSALMRDDWVWYWRTAVTLDGYQRRLLQFAESGVRRHALKCLGRSYLAVDKGFLEKSTGRQWPDLQQKDQVGWELDGERVVIRKVTRPKAK